MHMPLRDEIIDKGLADLGNVHDCAYLLVVIVTIKPLFYLVEADAVPMKYTPAANPRSDFNRQSAGNPSKFEARSYFSSSAASDSAARFRQA